MKMCKSIVLASILISGISSLYGMLDQSFGTNGCVVGPAKSGGVVAVQPDGKIVVGGSFNNATDIRVARYLSDGSPDTNTFGVPNGYVNVLTSGSVTIRDILIDTNNNIVITVDGAESSSNELIRFEPDGVLDMTFDGDGKVDVPDSEGVLAVKLQGTDLIILSSDTVTNSLVVRRYNNFGVLDGAFAGGTVRAIVPSDNSGDLWVLPDNSILVATTNPANNQFRLVKFNADGTPDNTFNGGSNFIDGPAGKDVSAIAVDSMGRIYMAGIIPLSFSFANRVVRRLSDGSLDISFNNGGFIDFGPQGVPAPKLALGDGFIFVTSQSASSGFIIVRLTENGIVNGSIQNPIGFSYDIALDDQGRIVLTGITDPAGMFQTCRYLPNFNGIVSPIAAAINALYTMCPV